MITKKEKGFTIIELLVVVAIIAVLAAIVLVNVTRYINEGKDAAIKGNMATILTNMAVWIDDNGTYVVGAGGAGNEFELDATYDTPQDAIVDIGKTVINGVKDTNDQFCACATLYATGGTATYCIDDTGYKKQTVTACGTRCADGTASGSGRCSD